MKKDYSVLFIQLDGNLGSDVLTRCSGHPFLHLQIPYSRKVSRDPIFEVFVVDWQTTKIKSAN